MNNRSILLFLSAILAAYACFVFRWFGADLDTQWRVFYIGSELRDLLVALILWFVVPWKNIPVKGIALALVAWSFVLVVKESINMNYDSSGEYGYLTSLVPLLVWGGWVWWNYRKT